jgi:hypothetical protein
MFRGAAHDDRKDRHLLVVDARYLAFDARRSLQRFAITV